MCDYEVEDEPMSESAELTFKVEYYFVVQILSHSTWKEVLNKLSCNTMFGFLYHIKELKAI